MPAQDSESCHLYDTQSPHQKLKMVLLDFGQNHTFSDW